MKFFLFTFLFTGLDFKCGEAKNPMLTTYQTIEESKQNKAFIVEYKFEQPYFEIEGYKHYIENAWLEHPHHERDWGDSVNNYIYCFVMNLTINPQHRPDLKSYIHEIGSRDMKVWLFVDIKTLNDTIELKYRSTLRSQIKNKIFKFYPIR